MQVQTGAADLVLAGGVESMSQVEFYSTDLRWGAKGSESRLMDRLMRARVTAGGVNFPVPGGMLETAENLRRAYEISRSEQDELALRSQRLAADAQDSGRFAQEIVPVPVTQDDGTIRLVDIDETPRRDTSLKALSALAPLLRRQDPSATVTAGNACGQSDGAALCIVTTRQRADALGLQPKAKLVAWATAGTAPSVMGIGPVPATKRALDRAELSLAEMDVIELNEAFAVQVIAVLREWNLSRDDLRRVNVNGSGISLGHPVGATGARILATMLYEMERRSARYGLETMCIGGGQGLAAIFENEAI
jgi:acetyl-CoA C-acetyltransferase